jgi:single-stranded DNA-binding protein
MDGNNFVELVGFLNNPQLKETRNGNYHFQGKVAVPFSYKDKATGDQKEGSKYIKISAWGDLAQELSSVSDGASVKVHGVFNERSYDGSCKSCGTPEKKYWTDVLVNNFVIVGG